MRSPCGFFVVLLVASSVLSAGCVDDDLELFIDIRTDVVAGIEFMSVRTELFPTLPRAEDHAGPDRTRTRTAAQGERFIDGVRVAELDGLSAGTYHVRVRLLDDAGRPLLQSIATVTLRETSVHTLVLTRSCRGVMCPNASDPGAITCVGGQCVDPRCTEEAPEYCGPASCMADSECVPSVACGQARCVAGRCLTGGGVGGACGETEWCHPEVGCEPLPTATCPEDPCRLVLPQCGCSGGEMCTRVVRGSPVRSCVPSGPGAAGDVCMNNLGCSTGTTCVLGESFGSCLLWCASDADCPGTACTALSTSPEVGVCRWPCDPVSDTGCAATLSCYVGGAQNLDGAPVTLTLCTSPGSRSTGATCMASWQCVPGHVCVLGGAGTDTGVCEVICDVDAPTCTPCTTLGIMAEDVRVGFCG